MLETFETEIAPTSEQHGMNDWIVVVDDEAFFLTNVKNILREQDMRVSCLRSGRALLKFMEKNKPDLILLDVLMPEMDGFETYHALRRMEEETGRSPTPVVFLSGVKDSETENRSLEEGACDFIHKPFNKEILVRRIRNAILNTKTIETLTEEAAIDKLTGLWNKTDGIKRVAKLCAEQAGALMILDLDNFKLVNDIHGHSMGDSVLKGFADIVRADARAQDVTARIGGDEFLMFACGMNEERAVAALARRLNEELVATAKKLMGEDFDIPLGISVGAAMVPEHGRDYEALFLLADGALYRAKQNGKHGCAVHQPEEGTGHDQEEDIRKEFARITKIVEERNKKGGALALGMDHFSFIYRFVQRFYARYGGRVIKGIFILSGEESGSLGDAAAEFGQCLQETLRKSDIILQNKPNQFFFLLPELSEADFQKVLQRIMATWEAVPLHGGVRVDYFIEPVVYAPKSSMHDWSQGHGEGESH